ncbi:MAG: hypothetical protein WCA56_22000 [Xanthobacteraceae bacterium]
MRVLEYNACIVSGVIKRREMSGKSSEKASDERGADWQTLITAGEANVAQRSVAEVIQLDFPM